MNSNIGSNALLIKAQSGNAEAQEKYLSENIGLVRSVVKKFTLRGVENDDLFQLGMMGLFKAVLKFDSSFGVCFSTYAVPMIAGEIKRYIRDTSYIKISRSVKELSFKISAETKKYEAATGLQPRISYLAEKLGCTAEEISTALCVNDNVYSLDETAGDDNGAAIKDLFADKFNLEEHVVNSLCVKEILSSLAPDERKILIMRYYKGKTQQEIASMIGISQVQVSRIEKRIVKKCMKNS